MSPGFWIKIIGFMWNFFFIACKASLKYRKGFWDFGTFIMCLFVWGGNKAQSFWPFMLTFQAEVPKGSWWIWLPERFGPIRSQRYGGRLLVFVNKSSGKYFGTE